MRVLWARAPLLLRRHPPLLAAVVVVAGLAALAATSGSFLRAAVESESLKGQLRQMSPLAAGLVIDVRGGSPIADDRARRAAATAVARAVPSLGAPVASSRLPVTVANADGSGLPLYLLARTGASEHVHRLSSLAGPGVWIADTTAKATGLTPGGTLRLTEFSAPGTRPRIVRLRVAGVYASLAGDSGNAYWVNWLHDVRTQDPNQPDPPAFVLTSEATLVRVARRLAPFAQNRFEFPVDPAHLTVDRAATLKARLDAVGARLVRAKSLGCRAAGQCVKTSSLDAALAIAARDVAALSPTVSLLSSCGLAIALGLALATGIFLVRRRQDEVHALVARGEPPVAFALRTAIETTLPALAGGVIGVAIGIAAVHAFAPGGALDGRTEEAGLLHAAAAVAATVVAVAVGAAAAFAGGRPAAARLPPWELAPLTAAAAAVAVVLAGGGLANDAAGGTHPRLAVFLVPALATAGVTGAAARGARRLLARRATHLRPAAFLALRRAAGARGLLVVVLVAAATAFATFAYAATLRSSLDRAAAEKAYVSNGSDVQAYIDPSNRVTSPFPFPVAIAELDQANIALASGQRVDLLAGDPGALARTITWGRGFGDDPRRLLERLDAPAHGRLLVLGTPDMPSADAIDDQGARIPITIVGRAPFPGQTAGRPMLVVSRSALRRIGRALGVLDPGPLSSGLLWAKGPQRVVEPALRASNLAPQYLTTPDHILDDAAVAAAHRSFGYVEDIGVAAAVLALIALLLYLQARQRAQSIASAFLRRMGLSRASDLTAVALEAAAVVAFATLVGTAVAIAASLPIVRHVDALPQYAPPTHLVVPWLVLAGSIAAATGVAAVLGALAVAIAARADVAEGLRVA